ncbi:MAG: cache domain-containing protein, partial [Verrucomicrobiota bacterium]
MDTIRNRILVALTATALVPLVVLYFTTDSMIRSSVMQTEAEKLEKINHQLATHVKTLMQSYQHDLRALQTDPILIDGAAATEMRLRQMYRLVDIYDFFSDISLYNREGYLIESTVADHPAYRESSYWFSDAIERKETTISRPQLALGSKGLNLSVYLPVFEAGGEVTNVVRARLTFDRISSLIRSIVPGESGEFILIDQWGGILSANSKDVLLEPLDQSRDLEAWAASALGEYVAPSGKKFLVSVKKISAEETRVDDPWGLVALQPMEEINALIMQAHQILKITTLVTLFGAAMIGIFLSNRFSKPLVDLSNTAKRVAKGDLDIRAEAAGSVELLELSSSFNRMVSDLREYQQGLENLVETRTHSLHQSQKEHEKTSAHLQAALEGSNNGFLVEDFNGQIIAVNQLFLDLFGFERNQVAGRGIGEVIEEVSKCALSKDDTEEIRNAIEESEGMVDKEIIFETPERCYLDIHSAPIRNNSGDVIGRVWTLRDNTENRD